MRVARTVRHLGPFGVVVAALLAMPAAQASQEAAGSGQPAPQPSFTRDVAPILQRRCQTCHRPDTFAPMSLLTYEDARPWARSIKQKVAAREIPRREIAQNEGIAHFGH